MKIPVNRYKKYWLIGIFLVVSNPNKWYNIIQIALEDVMEIFREILLGIIQGITCFLPVSSSGHVILLGNIFGMDSNYLTFYLSLLKFGSLLGLLVVMFGDVIKMIVGAFALIQDSFANIIIFFKKLFGREKEGYYVLDSNRYKRLVLMMIISSVVTAGVALFMSEIAKNMSSMSVVIGICFVLSAILLLSAERAGTGQRTLKNMGPFDAIALGMAQGIAIVPGFSRIVFVYALAMALGFGRNFAYKYACYLAVPTFLGTALYELRALAGLSVSFNHLADILIGVIVCCILSAMFLKLAINLVKNGLTVFIGIYGIILGIIVIICGMIL